MHFSPLLSFGISFALFGSNVAHAADSSGLNGAWSKNAKECKEFIIFSRDGTFTTISKNEVTTGDYRLNRGNGRAELVVNVKTDNKQVACDGDNKDSSGDSLTIFVTFLTPDKMSWYISPDATEAVMTLNRE